MTKNNQIADFLQYYFDLSTPPQYAVMLKGRWGTGKTFFIKDQLKKLSDMHKSLYVTLNGVSSKKEIEDEFFGQLHPFLASKGMRLTGRILKGALKGGLRLDMDVDRDGKNDGSATVGIPDVNLSEYLDNPSGLILIFDDLERCEIKIPEILGYINYFVEHHGYKVVIVANEAEIIEREQENQQQQVRYQRIREKLIGKAFEIDPDLDAALSEFLKELPQGDACTSIMENLEFVRDLYVASDYHNLRHLRQAVLDFARLVDVIDPAMRDQDMLRSILGTFLIYSFEIRAGNLLPEEILGLTRAWTSAALHKEKQSKLAALRKKYVALDGLDNIFPESLWAEMLTSGLLQKDLVDQAIRQSTYYAKEEDRPAWLRLWNAFELEDQALAKVLAEVQAQLESCEYDSVGVLKHVVGALLQLTASGIYPVSAAHIIALAKVNIDTMKDRGQLQLNESMLDMLSQTGWAGRGFHGADLPSFAELTKYISETTAAARKESYPSIAGEIVALMESDPKKFARYLVLSNHAENRYFKTPILAYANVAAFVNVAAKLQAPALSLVGYTIQNRYEHYQAELADEKRWLEDVEKQLEPKIAEKKGTMTGFWLHALREKVGEAAASLPAPSPALAPGNE